MKGAAYCLFETPIGLCGIAWHETADACAVTHLQIPEASPKATEQRIARISRARKAGVPPPAVAALIERIQAHLAGKLQDFSDVAIDLSKVSEFDRLVYEAARRIPPGETTTYGDLAREVCSVQSPTSNSAFRSPVDSSGAPVPDLQPPKAVGQAMARNPIPLIIPCHRVLPASGRLGGFSAHGERLTKAKLLEIERAKFPALLDFPT